MHIIGGLISFVIGMWLIERFVRTILNFTNRMGSRCALAGPRHMNALLDQLAAVVRLRRLAAVRAKKVQAINLSLVEYHGDGASRPRWWTHGRGK